MRLPCNSMVAITATQRRGYNLVARLPPPEKSAQKGRGQRILFMRSSTKDKIKGSLLEAKGKVKEESGKAVGNPDLRDRGTGEKVAGKVQKKVGDIKKVFGK